MKIGNKEFKPPFAASGQKIWDSEDRCVCRIDEDPDLARFFAKALNSHAERPQVVAGLINQIQIRDREIEEMAAENKRLRESLEKYSDENS